jgi:hypothetical protein
MLTTIHLLQASFWVLHFILRKAFDVRAAQHRQFSLEEACEYELIIMER